MEQFLYQPGDGIIHAKYPKNLSRIEKNDPAKKKAPPTAENIFFGLVEH